MGDRLEQLRAGLAQLGRQRLMMMGGVAIALLAALAFVALRGGESRMAFLYTDLDPAAAQAMADKLKAQNVPFALSADGTAVLAPEDRLAALRMSMAGEKLGGKIGYDVLDQEEPFGVSASRAKMNETRAIEGELARSIETLQSVTRARVHIVMPERAMFATSTSKASAAVTVKTRGRLSAEAVQSIRHLVASSVAELTPEAISVVDQTGALLARAGEAGVMGSGAADERQAQVEGKLRDEVEALLKPIVGDGKVRAEVSAEIDRDQTREESDMFDPDKQVVAHQVTVNGKDQNAETNPATSLASVGQQLPEAQGAPPAAGASGGRQEAHDETSEDITYENSKTHSVVLRAPGRIKRLNVAVMIDGGAKGLPAAQIQRLTRLVETAVGADSARGDSVVIESMAFAGDPALADTDEGWLAMLPAGGIADFVKLLLIAAVGLVALRMLKSKPGAGDAGDLAKADILLRGQTPQPAALTGPDGTPIDAEGPGGEPVAALDQEIALDQVDGRVKLSILQRVGDTISTSTPESASVIRQWMNA